MSYFVLQSPTAQRWLRRIPWPIVIAAAVGILLLVLHTLRFPRFFFDDAFISLRYADRLRSGEGLTWTDGERVEGCTNFLWVVLVAALGLVSDGLIRATRVLGVVCTAIAIVALVWAVRGKGWRDAAAPVFAALAIAALGPVAAWAVGGLEVSLTLAGLGMAIAFSYALLDREQGSHRLAIGLGAALAILATNRPDGLLFTATFCAGLTIARGFRRLAWRDAIIACAISAGSFGALSVFRRLYFGSWLPNTSFKLLASTLPFKAGWAYIVRDLQLWLPIAGLAGLAIVFAATTAEIRKRLILLVPAIVAWLFYVAAVGGDFMPQRRHLVPALFLLVAAAAEGIRGLSALRGRPAVTAWYLAISTCAIVAWSQHNDWAVKDANKVDWYWNGRPVGLFFRQVFQERDPLMAVDAAGSLPYFARLRSLDMLGLNDRYLATHPPTDSDQEVSHELGDGRYVLGRKPDLVVFRFPVGQEKPVYRSGKEMVKEREFQQNYQRFYYVTPVDAVEGVAFLRHRDGPLAPQWQGAQIQLPLYLMANRKTARATLDADERLILKVEKGSRTSYDGLALPGGSCTVRLEGSPDASLSLKIRKRGAIVRAGQPATLEGRKGQTLKIELNSGKGPSTVEGIFIECDGSA